MFRDLREYIDAVDKLGECKVVEGADWDIEIGSLSHLLSQTRASPLLLFDKIKGYAPGYRVAANLFATQKRIALALGLPLEARGIELARALRDRLRAGIKPVPPIMVKTGPVKENILTGADVDLYRFPAPKWHERDGGRYIGTGSMVIMRDPDDGWINVGTYRVQIQNKTTATIMTVPGHDGEIIKRKYWSRGQACPAAVCLGQSPVQWLGACWEAPWGLSEYDIAGWWDNTPVEVTSGVVTDLPIPATAEAVIEGELVPPEVESYPEGPFGEWTGYYARGQVPEPAFRVKSILHRDNPIIQGNPPSRLPGLYSLGSHIQRAAKVWDDLDKQIAGVQGVWDIEEATTLGMVVISLKQQYAGHARQAALIASGSRAVVRATYIVVVDEDIDPSDISQVLWALATRVDPETCIDVIGGRTGGTMFPALPPEKRKRGDFEMSRAIILACKPYYWIKDFPPSIETSPELAKKLRAKWKELFA